MKTQTTLLTAAWILLSGICSAQTSAQTSSQTRHWTNVDEHVSSDMETFRQLFKNAHKSGFGITILGDSQETPGRAHGRYYIPALGDQFYQYFGNVPKTGLVTELSQNSSWLAAGETAGEIFSDSELSLPSVNIKQYDSMPFENGLLVQAVLNDYTTPQLAIPEAGYFNGNPLEVELIIRTRPDSAEAFWQATLSDEDRRSYVGGELVGSGVTDVDADRDSIEFASAYLGTFDLKSHSTLQIIARSGEEDQTVDIAGVRFTNSVDSSGIAIQSLSKGGYSAGQFLSENSEAESLFKLLAGDDVIAIQYGTNDAKSGRTAEEFKQDLYLIISNVRRWSGNDSLPIMIISDPDFYKILPERKPEFDLYPGVAAELATELPNVLALNTRLIAYRNNWYVGSSDFDLYSDGLHYTQLGGETLARWQVASLMSLSRLQIKGTPGDDWVTFDPVAREVSVNGVVHPIPLGDISIQFFGEGGVDHVTAMGDPDQEEFAILQGNKMTVKTDDYFFAAYDVAELEFDSTSGSDTAVIYDSQAKERLASTPGVVQLLGDGTLLQAIDTGTVYVFSSGGDDSARIRGGQGSERVQASLESKRIRMTGSDSFISLSGFGAVNVNGGSGENDIATIVDSRNSEIVYFRGDFGRILSDDNDFSVRSFETVNFFSASENDIGVLQKVLDSKVSGNGIWGSLSGPGYRNNVFGLGTLHVREP